MIAHLFNDFSELVIGEL